MEALRKLVPGISGCRTEYGVYLVLDVSYHDASPRMIFVGQSSSAPHSCLRKLSAELPAEEYRPLTTLPDSSHQLGIPYSHVMV